MSNAYEDALAVPRPHRSARTRPKKNRGAKCPCGAGRGFRTERLARNVHDHITLTPAEYTRCTYGAWHWETTKETTDA